MTDADLAQICAKLYNAADPQTIGGIVFAVTKIEDVTVVAFRGSESIEDWMDDFKAVPLWTKKLGHVHAGFYIGLPEVYEALRPQLVGRLVITGHSLGGARARLLAGLCAVDGIPVERLVTFGSPRPAFTNLARVIQKNGMQHVSFRNRNDPVPRVPFPVESLDLDWQHTEDWTAVDVAPAPTDLEPLRDHHIELYEAGVAKLVDQVATA